MPGYRFKTAVPLVHNTTAGLPVACAAPSAINAAARSSGAESKLNPPILRKPAMIGALRDPGEITTCSMPCCFNEWAKESRLWRK